MYGFWIRSGALSAGYAVHECCFGCWYTDCGYLGHFKHHNVLSARSRKEVDTESFEYRRKKLTFHSPFWSLPETLTNLRHVSLSLRYFLVASVTSSSPLGNPILVNASYQVRCARELGHCCWLYRIGRLRLDSWVTSVGECSGRVNRPTPILDRGPWTSCLL